MLLTMCAMLNFFWTNIRNILHPIPHTIVQQQLRVGGHGKNMDREDYMP